MPAYYETDNGNIIISGRDSVGVGERVLLLNADGDSILEKKLVHMSTLFLVTFLELWISFYSKRKINNKIFLRKWSNLFRYCYPVGDSEFRFGKVLPVQSVVYRTVAKSMCKPSNGSTALDNILPAIDHYFFIRDFSRLVQACG